VSLAWGAGRAVAIPEDELNEALRRALVVRAVGGSPQREVTLDEDAVVRLAQELNSSERRSDMIRSLQSLRADAGPNASGSIDALVADASFTWRCFAAGCLAAELA
jgi:hypothetical protein